VLSCKKECILIIAVSILYIYKLYRVLLFVMIYILISNKSV